MQLEVEFETLALLEEFWAAIPPTEHRAWSQRARVNSLVFEMSIYYTYHSKCFFLSYAAAWTWASLKARYLELFMEPVYRCETGKQASLIQLAYLETKIKIRLSL